MRAWIRCEQGTLFLNTSLYTLDAFGRNRNWLTITEVALNKEEYIALVGANKTKAKGSGRGSAKIQAPKEGEYFEIKLSARKVKTK